MSGHHVVSLSSSSSEIQARDSGTGQFGPLAVISRTELKPEVA